MKAKGIYEIVNQKTGVKYIGQTCSSFLKRYHQHLSALRRGHHNNSALQQAWDMDGPDCFVFKIVRKLKNASKADSLWWEHRYIMRAIKTCGAYNILIGFVPEDNECTFEDLYGDRICRMYLLGDNALAISYAYGLPLPDVLRVIRKFNLAQ